MGLMWQGLIHDWSKFLPSEFFPYANHFYGDISRGRDKTGYYKPTNTGDKNFDFAWLLHQKRNMHHWQWWVLPKNGGKSIALNMPLRYRKEMLCDWRGASRAQSQSSNVYFWYGKNRHRM